MKKNVIRLTALILALSAVLCGCGDQDEKSETVAIDVWTYYNGDQLTAFDALVDTFNATRGAELGIVVENYSYGSLDDLDINLLSTLNGEVGAADMPNMFMAYSDIAYTAAGMNMAVDLSQYMTEDELSLYIDGYLDEGDFDGSGQLMIFPVAKSTELLSLNKTDWDAFASACGRSYSDLGTMEGLVETAQAYYKWTDAQTPGVPNDGKALYGRDSMANYMIIGAMQLGEEIFQVKDGAMTVNFSRGVARKLWDCYYIPFIKGYFAAGGYFRSDDIKTGNIVCYTGSSSGVFYFPNSVTISENESYPIEMEVLPAPQFEDALPYAVQQGAGMVVTAAPEREIEASVEFLKWLTSEEQDIKFTIASGYMPVTKTANSMDAIQASGVELDPSIEKALSTSLETVTQNTLFTSKPFADAIEARDVLDTSMNIAFTDRAEVLARLEDGQTLKEATAEFCTDEYFDAWYETVLGKLQTCEG